MGMIQGNDKARCSMSPTHWHDIQDLAMPKDDRDTGVRQICSLQPPAVSPAVWLDRH